MKDMAIPDIIYTALPTGGSIKTRTVRYTLWASIRNYLASALFVNLVGKKG